MSVPANARLPLPTLLSQALVAFIIEFDNEFEHLTPHQTTNFGSTPGAPWLVSMVMWSRFLRHIPDEGITVGELRLRARTTQKELEQWLTRLSKWWGYVVVEAAQPKGSSIRAKEDALVRPRAGGRKALAVWRTLTPTIEARWRERFGQELMERLRASLGVVAVHLDPDLPDAMPILGYGLFSRGPEAQKTAPAQPDSDERSLPSLLSRMLLAFAVEFESESEISLAIAANVLRLTGDASVKVGDLPRLSGVSKEAIAMAVSFLERHGYAGVGPGSPGSKAKALKLTAKGHQAFEAYSKLVWTIEERWQTRFGNSLLQGVRATLEQLIGTADASSPLMSGLQPYPDCWRAFVPGPETLPHFPMVLHRGGFPDGS